MTWWDSFDTLSKLQTALAILVSILGVATLTVKLRADHLKKKTDTQRREERVRLDKELQEKTAEALRVSAALEAKQAPRTLTESQRAELIRLLTAGPKGQVFVIPKTFDEEAEAYAQQIREVFSSAGFTVASLSSRPMGLGRSGTFIWVRDITHPPAHAPFIQQCFRQIGITLDGYGDATMIDENSVMIAISQKP